MESINITQLTSATTITLPVNFNGKMHILFIDGQRVEVPLVDYSKHRFHIKNDGSVIMLEPIEGDFTKRRKPKPNNGI